MYDIEKYYNAGTVSEAVTLLNEHPDTRIISGGSDVLIKIREGRMAGTSLVSIRDIEELKGIVQVDSEYMQRVMDNLISNLKKYGDPVYPLRIEASEQPDMLHIQVTNHIRDRKDHPESTQIGLKTCRKIMENHGGSFTWKQENNEFMITITLPLVKA